MKVEENDCCSVFLFKEIECEICKAKLPDLISHNGKLYSLLDFSDEFKKIFFESHRFILSQRVRSRPQTPAWIFSFYS